MAKKTTIADAPEVRDALEGSDGCLRRLVNQLGEGDFDISDAAVAREIARARKQIQANRKLRGGGSPRSS